MVLPDAGRPGHWLQLASVLVSVAFAALAAAAVTAVPSWGSTVAISPTITTAALSTTTFATTTFAAAAAAAAAPSLHGDMLLRLGWWMRRRRPRIGVERLRSRHRLHRLRPSIGLSAATLAAAAVTAVPSWGSTVAVSPTITTAALSSTTFATTTFAATAAAAAAPSLHGDVPLRLGWFVRRRRTWSIIFGLQRRHRLHRLRSSALGD